MAEIYVDPSINANSGTGTIGDPYGDLQYALDQTTQGASGDRFNIKAGTDEVLTATLNTTTYTAPSASQPVIFQGYTSAAGDGGIGGISGDGTYSIWDATSAGVMFIDMHLHNCGSAVILNCGGVDSYVVQCELNDTSGSYAVRFGGDGVVAGCYIHDFGSRGVEANRGVCVYRNFIDCTKTKKGTEAIYLNDGGHAIGNFIVTDSTAASYNGIEKIQGGALAAENTVISTSSNTTAVGIQVNGLSLVLNNYVEGFVGASAAGFGRTTADRWSIAYGNAAYNNTTNYSFTISSGSNNDSLGSSGVTNAATGDLTPA